MTRAINSAVLSAASIKSYVFACLIINALRTADQLKTNYHLPTVYSMMLLIDIITVVLTEDIVKVPAWFISPVKDVSI